MPVSQQVQIPHLSMVGAARVRGGLYGPRLHLIINVTSSSLFGWHRENSGLVFVTTPPLLELLCPSAHHLSPQEVQSSSLAGWKARTLALAVPLG